VIGNENRIRTNRSHHANLERDYGTPGFRRSPVALFESKFLSKDRVNFDEWFRTLINQRTNPPRL